MKNSTKRAREQRGEVLLSVADYLTPKGSDCYAIFVEGEADYVGGTEIQDGDLLIVDRSRAPEAGDTVLVETSDGLTVRAYRPRLHLVGADEEAGETWGVATFVVRALRKGGE